MRPVRGIARVLLGGLFIAAGAQAVMHPKRFVPHAEPVADQIAPMLQRLHSSLPTETRSLVQLNGAVQLGAGLLLATGTAPRPAAAVLAGTLIPATVANHPFWKASDPLGRRLEAVQFAKNLGLLAGLLLAAADTAGSPSLKWRTERALRNARKRVSDGPIALTR